MPKGLHEVRMLWLNDLSGVISGERIVFPRLDESSRLGRRMRMLFGQGRRSINQRSPVQLMEWYNIPDQK